MGLRLVCTESANALVRLINHSHFNHSHFLLNFCYRTICDFEITWQISKSPFDVAGNCRRSYHARMRTSFAGPDTKTKWHVVDANGKVLGRLATQIAMVLRGKHRPNFTPHADMGHRVAVVNAEKIIVTGNKAKQKTYFRYSGYPGGAKFRTFEEQMQKKPEEILRHAVKGM